MPGGIIQLAYRGYQDLAISGNPEITHFKFLYKKHTNFAKQNIEQTFNG